MLDVVTSSVGAVKHAHTQMRKHKSLFFLLILRREIFLNCNAFGCTANVCKCYQLIIFPELLRKMNIFTLDIRKTRRCTKSSEQIDAAFQPGLI